MTLHVRTDRDPNTILGEVRQTLLAIEPHLPLSRVQLLSALLASALFPARMAARLIMLFATLAMVLAAVGLYGAVSFAVSCRTREMGIRSALGADERDLMSLVIREGFVLVGAGTALGCGAAALVSRLAAGFLYGVSPADPAAFATATLLLGVVMFGATSFPARRASRSDPLLALRVE